MGGNGCEVGSGQPGFGEGHEKRAGEGEDG